MNYGLYLSASGVLTNTYRQDVFANNLANVETNGFKPDVPMLRQRDAESVEDQLGFDVSNEIMDKLGGGALAAKQRINFAPGSLKATGNRIGCRADRRRTSSLRCKRWMLRGRRQSR